MQSPTAEKSKPLEAVTSVLIDALRALEAAGEAEASSRLAGRAYAALRREHSGQAQRINALMHRPTRNLDPIKEQPCPPPNRNSTSAASRPPGATS